MATASVDLSSSAQATRRAGWVVIAAIILFAAFFGSNVWYRQLNLQTSQYDMGNMDQVLWHTIHGQIFQMTSPNLAFLQSRTAIHADFLLLVYTPFYAIWSDPRTMLVLQVLAVASGAIPLFWFARKKLGPWPGALLSVLYLLYPPLHYATTFDVHAVVLVIPLILWAWWAASERRWWWYGILAILIMLGKEEAGLLVAMMGLWWVWKRGYRWMGVTSIVVGVGWAALMVGWAIPLARHSAGHFALQYYSNYGDTYSDIIKNIASHPLTALRDMFDSDGWDLLKKLLFPLGGVSILGLPVFLLSGTELTIDLLSNNVNLHTIYYQYSSGIIPFVFLSAVYGWAWIRSGLQRWRPHWPLRIMQRCGVGVIIVCSGISVYQWGLLPGTVNSNGALQSFWRSPYRSDVAKVAAMLRPSDRVVATNNLAPQFSRRNLIWGFPADLGNADAIVVLEGGQYELESPAAVSADIKKLAADPAYTVVYHRDQFWYLRRN